MNGGSTLLHFPPPAKHVPPTFRPHFEAQPDFTRFVANESLVEEKGGKSSVEAGRRYQKRADPKVGPDDRV
jgi:hypothetical protein